MHCGIAISGGRTCYNDREGWVYKADIRARQREAYNLCLYQTSSRDGGCNLARFRCPGPGLSGGTRTLWRSIKEAKCTGGGGEFSQNGWLLHFFSDKRRRGKWRGSASDGRGRGEFPQCPPWCHHWLQLGLEVFHNASILHLFNTTIHHGQIWYFAGWNKPYFLKPSIGLKSPNLVQFVPHEEDLKTWNTIL